MKRLVVSSVLMMGLGSSIFALTRSEIDSSYLKSYNYEKMGRYSNAINAMAGVYEDYPKGYAVNLRLGTLYTYRQNYANALTHLNNAQAAIPNAIEPKLGKLTIFNLQERYSDAIKLGNQIIAADYYNYYGNLKLAYALYMNGDYTLSNKLVLKMLTIYPTDVLYLVQYGQTLYAQKNEHASKLVLSDVLLFDPENYFAKSLLRKINSSQSLKQTK